VLVELAAVNLATYRNYHKQSLSGMQVVAAYVLTDRPAIQALMRAADRGVEVRIYYLIEGK
jgi:hypothetical protein